MKIFLSAWWERLRTSYWFIPSILAISATALSFLTVHIDTLVNAKWVRATGWIWAGSAEGARNVLATIAGSTITVAGVIFSITIVALTLASSQFGPRLLRNFMGDRLTQVVLGVFVSTFLYCLLVLRTIRGTDTAGASFVPFLSVTCGLLFAVSSVGFLIFFIHHISSSILAENLIARVASELQDGIKRLFPESLGEGDSEAEAQEDAITEPALMQDEPHRICAPQSGFLQATDADRVLELASAKKLFVRLKRRPGDFVAVGALLAEVWPKESAGEEVSAEFCRSFYFGRQRTPTQDVEYSIDQLVEVAVRALSPGINDPFTAITCIEWLGVALILVGRRKIPSRYRCDETGGLRVITDVTGFAGIASACLDQIRQYGASSVAVVIRLLNVLARVADETSSQANREVLFAHARKIYDDGISKAGNADDREKIARAFVATAQALKVAKEDFGPERAVRSS